MACMCLEWLVIFVGLGLSSPSDLTVSSLQADGCFFMTHRRSVFTGQAMDGAERKGDAMEVIAASREEECKGNSHIRSVTPSCMSMIAFDNMLRIKCSPNLPGKLWLKASFAKFGQEKNNKHKHSGRDKQEHPRDNGPVPGRNCDPSLGQTGRFLSNSTVKSPFCPVCPWDG